jgi:hypothetical protein
MKNRIINIIIWNCLSLTIIPVPNDVFEKSWTFIAIGYCSPDFTALKDNLYQHLLVFDYQRG